MDFFQHRYYRLNKFLLKFSGLWPYQSFRVRVVRSFGALCLAISILIPHVTAIMTNFNNRDFMVECALPSITFSLCLIKYLTSVFKSHEMLKMLNHMRTDWKIWGRDCDVDILHEYAEKGRVMTILYTVALMTSCIVFVIQPVIPKIIDVLFMNGTEVGQFPIPVDYKCIDRQKYYFYVVAHSAVSAIFGFLVVIACDTMFMVYVQHSCGLFAILRHKLERLGCNRISTDLKDIPYGSDKSLKAFEYLGWCIDKHNHAIKFAELIDATYTWSFFFVATLNMILISTEGVQIVERTNELEIMVKLICCIIVALIHLYIDSYMGQILIDHSISIGNYIIKGKWYVLPLKAQKILALMIMRCNIPCKLTIAKLAVMSVETFGVILKTSLSYFTVLRSV